MAKVAKKTGKKASINRTGLNKLLKAGYTQSDLAVWFQISRQQLIRIINDGLEPLHVGVTYFINEKIDTLLKEAV